MEHSLSDLLASGSVAGSLPVSPALAVAGTAFVLSALLMACGVPGVIVPLSLTSGAFLNAELAAAIVAAGGAVGSHSLFVLTRRGMRDRVRERLGQRLQVVERAFARGGAWYVLGLRIAGTPSVVLTGACALLPINHAKFALASFAGFLPAAWIAASVGAAI